MNKEKIQNEKDDKAEQIEMDHIEYAGYWFEPSTFAIILATQKPPWYLRFVPNGVSNWRAKQKRLIQEYEKKYVASYIIKGD